MNFIFCIYKFYNKLNFFYGKIFNLIIIHFILIKDYLNFFKKFLIIFNEIKKIF
jgi:hypothetical protein